MEDEFDEFQRLAQEVGALLQGRRPMLQGAVLAEMLSIWLVGHSIKDDQAATDALREEMLETLMKAVRDLVVVNEKIVEAAS